MTTTVLGAVVDVVAASLAVVVATTGIETAAVRESLGTGKGQGEDEAGESAEVAHGSDYLG